MRQFAGVNTVFDRLPKLRKRLDRLLCLGRELSQLLRLKKTETNDDRELKQHRRALGPIEPTRNVVVPIVEKTEKLTKPRVMRLLRVPNDSTKLAERPLA